MNNKKEIFIVLEDIRSALNVGAIFRTCDATDVKKLFLTGITAYPPHNKIPKTALGATDTVDWEYHKNIKHVLDFLDKKHITIVSADIVKGSKNIYKTELQTPIAVVFGNEITGVSNYVQGRSKDTLHIPMLGTKESLNVATSCGIITYEILRQNNYCK